MLRVLETSSPSYLILAQIERCLSMFAHQKKHFRRYMSSLSAFRDRSSGLRNIRLAGGPDLDPAKLLFLCGDGPGLTAKLSARYHIDMEACGPFHTLGITSVADRARDFRRLACALAALDRETIPAAGGAEDETPPFPEISACAAISRPREGEWREPGAAIGSTGADFVYAYPPGVPLICPGETVAPETAAYLGRLAAQGVAMHGVRDGKICVAAAL